MTARLKLAAAALLLSSCSHVVERPLSIEAKPILEKEFGYTSLIASQGDIKVFTPLPPGHEKAPVQLDPKKSYRFDLIQERREMTGSVGGQPQYHWDSELVKISDGDRVIYDGTVCPVHRIHMERQTVPISYHAPGYTRSYLIARETRFPHATSSVLGIRGIKSEKCARLFRCESCIREERAWQAEHTRH